MQGSQLFFGQNAGPLVDPHVIPTHPFHAVQQGGIGGQHRTSSGCPFGDPALVVAIRIQFWPTETHKPVYAGLKIL